MKDAKIAKMIEEQSTTLMPLRHENERLNEKLKALEHVLEQT
jgi:hypothetical protein